jgi:hypothetical protein
MHHYIFAHTALREWAAESPAKLAGVLLADGPAPLKFLWSRVAETIPPGEQLSDEGLLCEAVQTPAGIPILLVTCPLPLEVPEAYFVALVPLIDGRIPASGEELMPVLTNDRQHGRVTLRYFTLERTTLVENPSLEAGCVCEWSGDRHLNCGPAPEPTQLAFTIANDTVLADDAQQGRPSPIDVESMNGGPELREAKPSRRWWPIAFGLLAIIFVMLLRCAGNS